MTKLRSIGMILEGTDRTADRRSSAHLNFLCGQYWSYCVPSWRQITVADVEDLKPIDERQTPVVDVQNTRQQTVMNRDVIDSIPTGMTAQNFAVLVPGVIAATAGSGLTAQDVGGSVGDKQVALEPGTMIVIPRGTTHGGLVATAGTLKFVSMKSPPQDPSDVHPVP